MSHQMPRYTHIAGLLLGLGVGMSQPALGQTPSRYPVCTSTASLAEREAAMEAYFAGLECHKRGDHREAIAYWEEAYRLDCNANLLLWNMGNAHELLEEWEHATAAFTEYLIREPNAPDRAEIEARIARLNARAQAVASTAPEPSKPPDKQTEPSKPAESTPQDPPQHSSSDAPWIVVGIGAAASIVGATLMIGGSSRVERSLQACDFTKDCTQYAETYGTDVADAVIRNGNRGIAQRKAGTVVLGIGLAGIGVGLVWGLAFNNSSTKTTNAANGLKWQPVLAPHYGGLSVGSHF